jgi:hypothetical protein
VGVCGGGCSVDRPDAEDEGDDAEVHVLVDAGEAFGFDVQPGFFEDFAAWAVFDDLVEFEHTAG